ncbi:hypothetical protein L873DRAFT_1753155 [Choiromyces venosus 120613-1]|uniref:DUF8040 domain-containing protein n=1 Tax=Choiromyces venosus 120613-1 TaxID=1336337 RepID=A0A3N4J0X4_9PEZI|nr:hypothetical protein L873DRAFT_1753155 [Choiromyces venosus 120613-1]
MASQEEKNKLLKIMTLITGTIAIAAGTVVNQLVDQENQKMPCRTSSRSGYEYTRELLISVHPGRIKECLWMELLVFPKLCKKLRKYGGLQDTKNSTIEHQVYIFFHTVSTDSSNCHS